MAGYDGGGSLEVLPPQYLGAAAVLNYLAGFLDKAAGVSARRGIRSPFRSERVPPLMQMQTHVEVNSGGLILGELGMNGVGTTFAT